MTNLIVQKLHSQIVDRVNQELEIEGAKLTKKYMATSLAVLVREKILTAEKARREVVRYGISLNASDLEYHSPYEYEQSGCHSSSRNPPNPTGGNRC